MVDIVNGIKYLLRFRLSRAKWQPVATIDGRASYAQAGQDLFVIEMHERKTKGTYVEVGAQDPLRFNNTFLLERDLAWNGISIELRDDYVYFFNKARKNKCILHDATQLDYAKLFEVNKFSNTIDYLQIDIDPAEASLEVLKLMPLERYRFGAITFEHDSYSEGQKIALESRAILTDAGYAPVALDVCYNNLPFEDWWIHPALVGSKAVFDGRLNGLNYGDVICALGEAPRS